MNKKLIVIGSSAAIATSLASCGFLHYANEQPTSGTSFRNEVLSSFFYPAREIKAHGKPYGDLQKAAFDAQTQQQLRQCTKAIAANPKNEQAYVDRGNCYATTVYTCQLAADDYSRAIALAPKNGETYASRALMYEWQQQHHKAIDDYTMAIKLSTDNSQYYSSRAELYLSMLMPDKAVADY